MRVLTWTSDTLYARYYLDRDYEPSALRIYAQDAPDSGDLRVDILSKEKDETSFTSIMKQRSYNTVSDRREHAYIEYNTLSNSLGFTSGETLAGGSSGATATVLVDDHIGHVTLLRASTTAFTVDEEITGSSTTYTANVNAYVLARYERDESTITGDVRATLGKGQNSTDAGQDFQTSVVIGEGSWVELNLVDLAGASGITIQLELNEISESEEKRE